MKDFMMKEAFNITQRIKSVEQTNCRDKVKHLREENHSKNEIIKILYENISSIAISTNIQVHRREITQKLNNPNDMLYQVPSPTPIQTHTHTHTHTQCQTTQVTLIRRSLLHSIDLKI